ncbi:hypothetical protein ACFLYE_04800 [Chloroflexota bacterium]
MKFLKGLAISVLSLLLFFSLSIFGTAFMLNQTLLNPDFVVSELNRLDMSSLAKETVIKQIAPQISQQLPQAGGAIEKVLDDTADDLVPWAREQLSIITYATYDYLFGKSSSLAPVISLRPVQDSLKSNLREAILQSPPPELAAVPPAMIEQFVSIIEKQVTQVIPDTFDLGEVLLSPEVRDTLSQVRQGLSYFQIAYQALMGFMLLLILCIFLISRRVKGTSRSLGTTFLTVGVLGYAGIFAAQYFMAAQIGVLGMPSAVAAWLPQFLNNLWAPLQTFNIAVAAAGLVLVIVSIVYRREPADAD